MKKLKDLDLVQRRFIYKIIKLTKKLSNFEEKHQEMTRKHKDYSCDAYMYFINNILQELLPCARHIKKETIEFFEE